LYVLLDLKWEPRIILAKYGLSFNLNHRLNIKVGNNLSIVTELKECRLQKVRLGVVDYF
jgi:hypothetical protein